MARMGRMGTVALVGALLACTDGTGTRTDVARVTLQLTDAPGAPFASATVDIGPMQLIHVDGEPITITEDAGEFDLLAGCGPRTAGHTDRSRDGKTCAIEEVR